MNIVWEPVLEMDREAHVVASQTIHKNACVDYAMGIVLLTSARAPNTRQGRGEEGHITNATPKQPGTKKDPLEYEQGSLQIVMGGRRKHMHEVPRSPQQATPQHFDEKSTTDARNARSWQERLMLTNYKGACERWTA